MKREDQTYEKWLDKLKNTEPVLNAPEELTNDILFKIKTLPSGTSLLKEAKGKSKTNRILLSVSKISGIAAALLLCFLISETIFFSQDKQYPEQSYANNAIWQGKAYSLPDSWLSIRTMEGIYRGTIKKKSLLPVQENFCRNHHSLKRTKDEN